MLYVWTESMAVGLSDIDEQHREILGLASDLLLALKSGREHDEARKLVVRLGDRLLAHQRDEEACMIEYGYPGLAGHRVDHEEFVKEFAHARATVERDPASPFSLVAVQRNVCERMLDHVRQLDRSFGSFVGSRGYRAAA